MEEVSDWIRDWTTVHEHKHTAQTALRHQQSPSQPRTGYHDFPIAFFCGQNVRSQGFEPIVCGAIEKEGLQQASQTGFCQSQHCALWCRPF